MNIEETLHQFIVTELDWQRSAGELTSDTHLLDGSAIDSMSVLQLVTFIEEHFGVEVLDEELIPEHFGTLQTIGQLVESKSRVSTS